MYGYVEWEEAAIQGCGLGSHGMTGERLVPSTR